VQETPYGRDYLWQPAHALIECDCGQVMDADEHHPTCPNCGVDHRELVLEVAGRHLSEEVLHPWHRDYEEWQRYKETRGEYQEWLEQRALDST
jgi:protein-tyrosine-phosphatase